MVEFFEKGSAEDFENVLKMYPKALEAKAKQRKKKESENLESMDKWMQEELPLAVASRSPPHLTQSELVQLVKWKLARGKFRPRLVTLAGSNREEEVKKITGESLKLADKCKKGKEEEALKVLVKLKGIGPATASAILAVCCPKKYCFYADEVARTALHLPPSTSLRYTLEEYMGVLEGVCACVGRLNGETSGDEWSPHRVELALWSYCVLEENSPHLLPSISSSSTSSSPPPLKKRKN